MNDMNTPAISFGKIPPKFVLMGAGYHLCAFARILVKAGLPAPLILTYPWAQHERDRMQLRDPRLYSYVFDMARELGLETIEAEKVNDSALIARLLGAGCTAAFSLSCRSIIRREFIDAFHGLVFNIHPSPLPAERGGGTYTWRILQGQRHVAVTIHLVDEGIDTGAIVSAKRREVAIERPVPRDLILATNALYDEALQEFAAGLAAGGRSIAVTAQDESQSTYLPRLCTEVNGAIDWSWSLGEIDRFIRGYSYPYSGAFTFAGERRFSILEAYPDGSAAHHPALWGRVDRLYPDGSARVLVRDGFLRVQKLHVAGDEVPATMFLVLMDILHTPAAILEEARTRIVGVKEMSARLETAGTEPHLAKAL